MHKIFSKILYVQNKHHQRTEYDKNIKKETTHLTPNWWKYTIFYKKHDYKYGRHL